MCAYYNAPAPLHALMPLTERTNNSQNIKDKHNTRMVHVATKYKYGVHITKIFAFALTCTEHTRHGAKIMNVGWLLSSIRGFVGCNKCDTQLCGINFSDIINLLFVRSRLNACVCVYARVYNRIPHVLSHIEKAICR